MLIHPQGLEFQAGQRIWALQDEATRSANESQLRAEVAARQAAAEAKRSQQLQFWEMEEKERAEQQRQEQVSRTRIRPGSGHFLLLRVVSSIGKPGLFWAKAFPF